MTESGVMRRAAFACALALVLTAPRLRGAGPSLVDITWFSVSNVYYELGPLGIIADGLLTGACLP